MKMSGVKTAVAAAALSLAGSAFAIVPDITDGTLPLFGAHAAGSFSDTYDFSISPGGLAGSAAATSLYLGNVSLSGVTSFAASLSGGSLGAPVPFTFQPGTPALVGPVTSVTDSLGFFQQLGAGTYALTVTGVAVGSVGTYGGALNHISVVPEPSAYLMALAGVALMGLLVNRRRPSDKS